MLRYPANLLKVYFIHRANMNWTKVLMTLCLK